jgi:hypothetical protein
MGMGMKQQEVTTVVPLPLATVEMRLRDVESWSRFLPGVGSIRYTSHERYLFTLADGRDRREVRMVVKLLYHDHCFVWHAVAGPTLRGTLQLAPVDDRQTAVTLSQSWAPVDLRSGMVDMLMPHSSTTTMALQRLEHHLINDFPAEARS